MDAMWDESRVEVGIIILARIAIGDGGIVDGRASIVTMSRDSQNMWCSG
jgi:hypothetical protein